MKKGCSAYAVDGSNRRGKDAQDPPMTRDQVLDNYRRIRDELSGYPGVRLVAVSKRQDARKIAWLAEAGQLDFGENYLQEWLAKKSGVPAGLRWHFIGRLQSRKVPELVSEGVFSIHGFGSESSLAKLNALERGPEGQCFLQVNLENEIQKGGASEKELEAWASGGQLCRISGLMSIPPADFGDMELAAHFRRVRELASRYNLPGLSMGMSNDWRIAVSEGATVIRLGTSIFGERE